MTSILIHHFLEQSAKSFPDKIALIHEEIRATYKQINTTANHLARGLLDLGVNKGDRVVLILENSLEYVAGYYAALKTGALVVPLSSDLKPDGLRPLLAELEPKIILSSARFERLLKATDLNAFEIQAMIIKNPKLKWADIVSFKVESWEDVVNDQSAENLNIKIDQADPAGIIYTSGSTGIPKGVVLSHENIVSNTHAICRYLDLTQDDIQMVVLPFFYVMGKSLLNTHIAVGGTVVINNKFAYPATVIKQMVDENVTGFSGVPSTYAYLLHRSPLEKHRDQLKSLRYCSQAGGHMSQQIKRELRRVLPEHTRIFIMYGATEASARLTFLDPDWYEEKIGSIGKPIQGVTLKVLDKDNLEVPAGQVGELVGDGANIMHGYWKDEQSTRQVLDQNGYHTGDLGYMDPEGFYYVQGRKDNLLKVGGHRINPTEIEDAMMETGFVIETGVVGVPDKLLGNKLVALVVSKEDNVDDNAILSRCSGLLPKYKLPSEVKLVRALPKSTSGKIDKVKCLAMAEK